MMEVKNCVCAQFLHPWLLSAPLRQRPFCILPISAISSAVVMVCQGCTGLR